MRLLLDQGLPRSAAEHLSAAGHIAEHVGDLGLASASDEELLNLARRTQAVVVTLDADFHALLAASRADRPSVIRIRVEGLKGDELSELVLKVLSAVGEELAAGAAVSVTSRIRVHALPIGR